MTPHQHGAGSSWPTLVALVLLAAVGGGYLLLALRHRRGRRGWSPWRTGAFVGGLALLAIAVTPQLAPFPAGTFHGHMAQHLLIGMYAPLGLVLGAPVTLLLRSVRPSTGRGIVRVLRSRPVHLVAHPITALALVLGGLAVLYLTPLYDAIVVNPALHHLVHLHVLASGCLFAWAIAGPDPAPARPSVPVRLVVLGAAVLGHAVLSQLIYAGLVVRITAPAGELRAGGDLMYFGGDIAELLLAVAMLAPWRPQRRGRAARAPFPSTSGASVG